MAKQLQLHFGIPVKVTTRSMAKQVLAKTKVDKKTARAGENQNERRWAV